MESGVSEKVAPDKPQPFGYLSITEGVVNSKTVSVKITCISKDGGNHYNRHEAIRNFGWLNESTNQSGNSSLVEIIKFLEDGNSAYVVDRYDISDKAYLMVREREGRRFVQTVADREWSDNLLQLPECSR